MRQLELKLNIGCGPNGRFQGYINIDNSPSVLLAKFQSIKKILYLLGIINKAKYEADWSGVFRWDVSKGIPYRSDTVGKIYSSHLLEHIPCDKGSFFIKECYRVLKKGGVVRIVVPDLLWYAERYVHLTRNLINRNELPTDRSAHDEFLDTIYGAYLKNRRYGADHYYMYDIPTLVSLFTVAGFSAINKCEFRYGFDEELASFDSRQGDSLYLEGIK